MGTDLGVRVELGTAVGVDLGTRVGFDLVVGVDLGTGVDLILVQGWGLIWVRRCGWVGVLSKIFYIL